MSPCCKTKAEVQAQLEIWGEGRGEEAGGGAPIERGGGWSWPQPLREAQREAREIEGRHSAFVPLFSVHVQAPQSIDNFP